MFHLLTSFLQHCQTLHSNLVLKTVLPTVFWQRIHNHLLPPVMYKKLMFSFSWHINYHCCPEGWIFTLFSIYCFAVPKTLSKFNDNYWCNVININQCSKSLFCNQKVLTKPKLRSLNQIKVFVLVILPTKFDIKYFNFCIWKIVQRYLAKLLLSVIQLNPTVTV